MNIRNFSISEKPFITYVFTITTFCLHLKRKNQLPCFYLVSKKQYFRFYLSDR